MADASGKKTKKIATARKNSNTTLYCTHLPLPDHTQAHPKAKSKECNRQRFVRSIIDESKYDFNRFSLPLPLKIISKKIIF